MKNKSINLIDDVSKHMFDKFNIYNDKYDITGKITLTIYSCNSDGIPDCIRYSTGVASTTFSVFFDDDDDIIDDIISYVYVPIENIFKTFIDSSYDYNYLMEYFDMILLHEIGHIIYARKNYIGKSINDIMELDEINEELKMRIPKLRKNASRKSRIKWYRSYFSLPIEKGANDSVGITIDDIIHMETKMLK